MHGETGKLIRFKLLRKFIVFDINNHWTYKGIIQNEGRKWVGGLILILYAMCKFIFPNIFRKVMPPHSVAVRIARILWCWKEISVWALWPVFGKGGQRPTVQKHSFLFNHISIQVTQNAIVKMEVVIFFLRNVGTYKYHTACNWSTIP
jgi:hypothetical protein